MNLFSNQYFTMLISLTLVIYSSIFGKNVPRYYKKVFNNQLFKVGYLFLIYSVANHNLKLALLLSVAYLITHINLTKNLINENFSQLEHFIQLEHFTNDYALNNKLI